MQETGRLTKIPGIGKKTAERLLLELKDKIGADLTAVVGVFNAPPASSDILHALLALGYSDKEAVAAVKRLPEGLRRRRRHPAGAETAGEGVGPHVVRAPGPAADDRDSRRRCSGAASTCGRLSSARASASRTSPRIFARSTSR